MSLLRGAVVLLALVGCKAPQDPVDQPADVPVVEPPGIIDEQPVAGPRSRSGAVVTSSDPYRTFIADADNGQVLLWDRSRGMFIGADVATGAKRLQSEPTRMARIGEDLFVTLRGTGELARLRHDADGLHLLGAVAVGAEPYDVVGHPTAATVLVSLSMEDAVVELDAVTLAPLRRWEVAGEPRWLATRIDPVTSHTVLAVASMRGGQITLIDLDTGNMQSRGLPTRERTISDSCPKLPFSARITGEISFDDVGNLYVPSLYADTKIEDDGTAPPGCGTDSSGDVADTGFSGFDTGGTPSGGGGGGGYGEAVDASFAGKTSRFNPILAVLPPAGPARTLTLATLAMSEDGDALFGVTVARGVASGVELFERDGQQLAAVTMESDGSMVVLNLDAPVEERQVRPFETVQRMGVSVGLGALSPRYNDGEEDQIVTWSWLDRTTSSYLEMMLVEASRGAPMVAREQAFAPPSQVDAVVQEGRRMFFSTDDVRMAASGSGVSCAACHADGRTDGFTWQFADFDRQTPSLAGPVHLTEPVTWKGDVDTVEREVHLTTTQRMGGEGVSFGEAETVAAYVNWSRGVVVPKGDAAQVARGKALFERADVACVSCHAGEQGTYGATVPLYGLPAVNVPGLKGIRATAPYFHDGSAATLRDVLVRSRDGSMGDTGALSASEMDDLEAYLRQF